VQETTRQASALERYGIGVAIAALFVCAIALTVKLFSGFMGSAFMQGGFAVTAMRNQAENGNPQAQYFMGEAYLDGAYGLPKDANIAIMWFKKAQAQHFAPAGCELSLLHLDGHYADIDDAQAVQFLMDGVQAHNPSCTNSAAWLKATSDKPALRDPQAAETLAKTALGLSPQEANYMDTLAAAFAAEGRFDMAVMEQQRAISTVKGRAGDVTSEVNDMQGRLDLYKAGKPYVETTGSTAAPQASTQPAPSGDRA